MRLRDNIEMHHQGDQGYRLKRIIIYSSFLLITALFPHLEQNSSM